MRYLINENNPPPQRLRVHFSSKLNGDIRTIVDYNKENVVALKTWKDYIKSVKLYVGYHVIAWDDMGRYPQLKGGDRRFIPDFGYNVGYTLIPDYKTGVYFVYIFMLNLQVTNCGLKIPPSLIEKIKENKHYYNMKQKIRLTEGDLHRIVRECINEALLTELDWKTYANAEKKARNRGTNYWREKGRKGFDAIHDTAMSRIRADRFGHAAQDAFDRDYGYQQGELGDDNYQRVGMGGEFGSTEEFGPHAAGWKKEGYWRTTRFPHGIHCHQRTPEEFFDGNDDAVDAYNKAKEEMRNFKKGNYDYIKGKGYQLKN